MTALPSLPLLVPVVATTGRNLCDSPLPTDTCARCSVCLAMASVLGFVRRCLPARAAAALASSLYFLQGTLQKIHLHRLLGEQALELKDFLSVGRRMGTRARCFFAWFSRFKLSAPLVEASSGYPELLSQLIHALASPHPFYGHALDLPGISLSSLHSRFLSRRVCPSRVCQFKGSVQLIVMIQQQIAMLASDSQPNEYPF